VSTFARIPLTRVRSHAPVGINGGYVAPGFDSVTLTFSRPVEAVSLDPGDFQILGPTGPITVQTVVQLSDRVFRIDFPAQVASGLYRFSLLPSIVDADGLPLDQNANGVPGEPEDMYSFTLTVDLTPPRITNHTSADLAGTVSQTDIWVSEKLDRTSLTSADIVVSRPDSQIAAVTGIEEVGFNRFRITFTPQTLVGTYHVRIGPDVRDLAGNRLDQDRDGSPGEPVDDVYDAWFNLVPVDLGLNSLSVPGELWAGEQVTVSWQGMNRTAPRSSATGSMSPTSPPTVADIDDIKLAQVRTPAASPPVRRTPIRYVLIPGKLPGTTHPRALTWLTRRRDERGRQPDRQRTARAQRPPAADDGHPTHRHPLLRPGGLLAITLGSLENSPCGSPPAGGAVERVSYAAIPTRMSFDERSAAAGRLRRSA
jgi:hypothetical protein